MISSGFRHLQKATTVFHLYMVIYCFFQSLLLLLLEFEWTPTGLWTDTNSELPQSQVLLLACRKQCFELWVMFLVTSIALLNFSFWMNKIVFHYNQVAFPCSFFFRIWKKQNHLLSDLDEIPPFTPNTRKWENFVLLQTHFRRLCKEWRSNGLCNWRLMWL